MCASTAPWQTRTSRCSRCAAAEHPRIITLGGDGPGDVDFQRGHADDGDSDGGLDGGPHLKPDGFGRRVGGVGYDDADDGKDDDEDAQAHDRADSELFLAGFLHNEEYLPGD